MGVIISKFRKEKTTAVVLEGLEEKIQQLEKYTLNTQERKKRFVSCFLGVSIGVYVVVFVLLYFFYLPPTWKERVVYLVPLFLFPFVINLLRHLFTWYFQRKLNKNSDKLIALREKKTQILEQVMDKETYKVAVNLLERFGDKKLNRPSITGSHLGSATTRLQKGTGIPTANSSISRSTEFRSSNSPQLAASTPQKRNVMMPYQSVYRSAQIQPSLKSELQLTPHNQTVGSQELRRRTPFPIVDARNRTAIDRIVDAIVGDSPHDRYAMICKQCFAHNGMAPKEEYDYATYCCAFCSTLNPARKTRPIAPRLSLDANQATLRQISDSTDSSTSDDDADDEENSQAMFRATLPNQETDTTTDVTITEDVPTNTNIDNKDKKSSPTPLTVGEHEQALDETAN